MAAVAPAGVRRVVADLHVPEQLRDHAVLVVCLPGGGMSRRYHDLDVPGYSFARHLADAGFLVLALDHPGVGESDRPDDGYALSVEVVADVGAHAIRQVVAAIRDGTCDRALAPLPELRSIGLGHSAGGLVTVHQQARHRLHAGLVLLGYANRGLPDHPLDDLVALVDDVPAFTAAVQAHVRAQFGDALPMMPRGSSDRLVKTPMDEPVHEALVRARTNLLGVVGTTSMVRGSAATVMAAVDVPVFLGLGEHDLTTDFHHIPAGFPGARDVTLVVLPGAGHNHHVAPTRIALWDRVVAWLDTLWPAP